MQISVLEYLELTAQRYPDRTAFADARTSLTYAMLQEKARKAGTAIWTAVKGELRRPVVVMEDHTPDCIAAFMGVVYSGNCYVPVEATMPTERLQYILDTLDPAAVVLMTQKPFAGKVSCPVLHYEAAVSHPCDLAVLEQVRNRILDIDPLYIIFTSGSTGRPKGVVISHRAMIDFTDWLADVSALTPEDVLANQAPFHFDMSGKDIYQALKSGASVQIFQSLDFAFPARLVDRMNKLHVTAAFWAAAAVRMVASSGILKKEAPHNLRLLAFGGEALSVKYLNCWRDALPGARYINMYGPTETTVDCAYYLIERPLSEDEAIPIGKACANKQLLLVGEDGRMIETPGKPGELYMRGSGMAMGYYRDAEKTAAAFVQNPGHNDYIDRLYRTGDIAQYNQEGLLVYLARKDLQIKHMGYRIELGEVEAAVEALAGIHAAVCLFDDERDRIVLCYEGALDHAKLIAGLKERLPKYMLPNICIHKERMPYTSNQKIDRVALKEEYLREAAQKRGGAEPADRRKAMS